MRSLLVAILCLACAAPAAAVSKQEAEEIHRRAVVVDGHADTVWWVLDRGYDIGRPVPQLHMDLPRMRAGGVDAQFFSIWPSRAYGPDGYLKRALQMIDALYGVIDRHPDRIALARSVDDIERIAAEGRIAALMGVEGGHALQDDLGVLRILYRLGVRYLTLTWSFSHGWADSSSGPTRWNGLNDFGVDVVREMNRLGMLIDVSHASEATFADALRVTRAPVIASHSSARALSDHPRNMTDAQIGAMGENGGVIMINFFSKFLDERFRVESDAAEAARQAEFDALGKEYLHDPLGGESARWELWGRIHAGVEPPPLDRIVDHVDHIVGIAGIDHVGLGSDFDGVTSLPRGLEDCAQLPELTRALLERGYDAVEVTKILGGNLLRVFREVERVAASWEEQAAGAGVAD